MRCWLVDSFRTIWYVPRPVNCRSGGGLVEIVAHATSTTANSSRIGVAALGKGTRSAEPATGHSRMGHRHGAKQPSSYVEALSAYGADTGLERMSMTVSKQDIPFFDIAMSISGEEPPTLTRPLSQVCAP